MLLGTRGPIHNERLCVQLVIVRSYTEVQLSSEELFTLLTSDEGAKILDDTTNHTDPPLATLDWKSRYMHYVVPAQVSHTCPIFISYSGLLQRPQHRTTLVSSASIHVPHGPPPLLLEL